MAKYISLIGTPKYNEQFENDALVDSIISMDNFKKVVIDASMDTDNYNVNMDVGRVGVITIAEMSRGDQAERVVEAIAEALDNDKIKVIKLKDIIESTIHPKKRKSQHDDDSSSIRIDCSCCMIKCTESGPICHIHGCPNEHFHDKRKVNSKDDSSSIRIDCSCCMMKCTERGPVCSINGCPNEHFRE